MLAQLESKILDLQTQIESTQAQITDYRTNRAYRDYYYTCLVCQKNIGKNIKSPCHRISGVYNEYFTKTAELAQAQASLATLQNELNATQEQYEQEKEQQTKRAMILNQAFVSAPPPSKNIPSQKVLKSIESLQEYLKQKNTFTTALARRAVVC